jgi:hypothetical protein
MSRVRPLESQDRRRHALRRRTARHRIFQHIADCDLFTAEQVVENGLVHGHVPLVFRRTPGCENEVHGP